jgi:hypothetical protein
MQTVIGKPDRHAALLSKKAIGFKHRLNPDTVKRAGLRFDGLPSLHQHLKSVGFVL